jgi:signal peptidase II
VGNFQYLLIIVGVFALDRGSKFLAGLGYRNGHPIFFRTGFFSLRYIKNSGGAFGLFPRRSFLFLGITLIAVGMLAYLLFFSNLRHTVTKLGLALLLGGSLGNLVDRILSGAVVDFIRIWRAPIFNVADIAIVGGAGLVLFTLAGGMKLLGQ